MATNLPLLPAQPPVQPVATPEQLARVKKVSREFEESFLQVMMGEMFNTVQSGAFGGGEGEEAYKSFLTEAFSKQITAQGGIGLSHQLTTELLKMQGLTQGASA
jgi:Rod binding domain-containing protein